MAKGFNLTAELNLRGPSNLRSIVSNIKSQLNSVSVNIKPTVSKTSIQTIATDIRSRLNNVSVGINLSVSNTAIRSISADVRRQLGTTNVPINIRLNRASLTQTRRDIRARLSNINANVNVNINNTTVAAVRGLNTTLNTLNTTLLRTARTSTNAANAIRDLTNALRGAASTRMPRTLDVSINGIGAAANTSARNLSHFNNQIEGFGRQAGLAIRRFAAFTAVTSVFYGLGRAIQSGLSEFIEFDRQLVRLSQVTGDSMSSLKAFRDTIISLSTTYGVSSKSLAEVSVTLAQAGISARDTEKALKALALTSLAPSFDNMNNTVEGSIALMRQFGISAGQLEQALGSINSVAAKFAVEAGDVIAAIQRTGGVFAAASRGVSEGTDALNEFVAVFTSIRATTRESAETIATGLRTIFTRIQRGSTIEALKDFGVTLTDTEGKFVGAYKAVELLSTVLRTLDPRDLRFSEIVEELGGFRQIGKVIPLIQEFATAQAALKVAQEGSGSLAQDASKGQLSLAIQISKVREEFGALIKDVADTGSFRTFIRLGLDLASSLIKVADAAKELIPLIGLFTAFRGAQSLTRFATGFTAGVSNRPRGFASGGLVPGVGNTDSVSARLTPGEFVIRKKAVESIGVNNLAQLNHKANGGKIKRFAIGGASKKSTTLPMIDDITQASSSFLPIPSNIGLLIKAGGGAVDIDRTLLRTIGDKAYSRARTPEAQKAVLDKYFRSSSRLTDIKSAGLTGFGTELLKAIKESKLNPNNISVVSKSRRMPGVAEYLSSLFGIPISNMVFTQGGDKEPPLKKLREYGHRVSRVGTLSQRLNIGGRVQRFANGQKAKRQPMPVTPKIQEKITELQAAAQGSILSQNRVGVAILTPPKNQFTDTFVKKSQIIKSAGPRYQNLLNTSLASGSFAIDRESLSSNVYNDFNSAIENGLMSGVNSAVTQLSSKYPLPKTSVAPSEKKAFLSGINNAAKGNLFEQILTSMKNKGKWDASADPQAPFDFVGGMGDASSLFPKISGLRYIDAKASYARDQDMALKIANQTLREIGVVASKRQKPLPISKTQQAIFDSLPSGQFTPFIKSTLGPSLIEKIGSQSVVASNLLFKSKKGFISHFKKLDINTQREIEDKLSSIQTQNLGGIIKRYAFGGSVGSDTVPALLTPGEFVINKKAAQKIGASRLNTLNRADKVKGYNTGGSVGTIPRYGSGGDVQRFFFGGRPSARPGQNANSSNMVVIPNIVNQLTQLASALSEVGIEASSSANLVRNGSRISARAAEQAYQADILRLRVAGAPLESIMNAETQLANIRQQSQQQIRAQRQLRGVGGAQLERIDTMAQNAMRQYVNNQTASGGTVDEAFLRRTEDLSYRRAGITGGLRGGQMVGLTGQDLRQFITASMGDPRTFEQMNREFRDRRAYELNRQYQDEIRAGSTRTLTNREIRNALRRAERDATEEARIRRSTLNQTRNGAGPGGTTRNSFRQGMFGASFMLPMLAQMISSDPRNAGSAGAAATSAATQGGLNTAAMGIMMMSMLENPVALIVAALVTATAGIGQAFIDARNATIEFEKNLASKRVSFAIEDTSKLFEKLSLDLTKVDIQQEIGAKLVSAAEAAQRGIEVQTNTAKAFWFNMIDAFTASGKEVSERSQILEKYGISAYTSTTSIGQTVFGGAAESADQAANVSRAAYTSLMIPEQAREIAKSYSNIADSTYKLIETQIRSGKFNINDIIDSAEFEKLSGSLAMANTTIAEQILSIRNSILLTNDEKKAQEALIVSTYAETEARRRAAIISREIEIREAKKATAQISRSLERMYRNMEQSINRTNAGLEQMSKDLDLVSASLTGQAKLADGLLRSINILQNPNAFARPEVERARSQASGFFGDNAGVISGLLELNTDIESTIMSSINNAIKNSDGEDSPEKIAISIERAVKDKLKSLNLPADISAKLSREVRAALEEIRKQGDEKADFSQIEEKLQGLSQIFDSASRAQETAIMALENWNNALNSYSSSMNQLVDLQVSYNSQLRRGLEIQINNQAELNRALGKDLDLQLIISKRNALARRQTGGLTQPEDIYNNVNRLEAQRVQQEQSSDIARQQGPSANKDFIKFQNDLVKTTVALRENYDALKNLAENSDVAAAALNKIQEAQQRQQGRVGFIEKLVTSTPAELDSLNQAFFRLQRNINGQLNTINTSVGAQKAFNQAIAGGASMFEAARSAQEALASERRDTLGALNEIIPFLGSGEKANQIRANTLQSMLIESGVGISPMFQEVLNSLRNPELDPATQQAVRLYTEANQLQIKANDLLGQISKNLEEETADKAAKAIVNALSSTVLTFKLAEERDLNRGVIPQNRASGGIIYASKGIFTPKGSDTVPAMLTPGEFVVNKTATANNLPLLQSINSNKYSSGGTVKYLAKGGYVTSKTKPGAKDSEDFMQTKEEFLDLKSPEYKNITSGNSDNLYSLPNTFLQTGGMGGQTPARDMPADQSEWMGEYLADFRFMGRRQEGIYNLKDVYNGASGDIVLPGYVTNNMTIDKFGSAYGEYPTITAPARDPRANPISEKLSDRDLILGLSKENRVGNLPTINYEKRQFDTYKKEIDNLKKYYSKLTWASDPGSLLFKELKSVMPYPDNFALGADKVSKSNLNPVFIGNNPLYATNKQEEIAPNTSEYATIWRNSAYRGAYAVTSGKTPPSFHTGTESFSAVPNGTMQQVLYKIDKDKIIKSDASADILRHNIDQEKIIKKTILAMNNNFKDLEMIDSPDTNRYKMLQEKLALLYNGFSVNETFDDSFTDLFDISSLQTGDILGVVAGDNRSRQSILRYIEKTNETIKAGEQPSNAGGKKIKIGLDRLPAFLDNDKSKSWIVDDIFDIDYDGKTKYFPYLVNLSPSEITADFEQRAKDAAARKKSIIQTQIINDKNKLKFNVNPAKSIEIPYNSTYTKYSGPLWDVESNSFSDKLIKDIFLPEKSDLFGSLEVDTQRLGNLNGPFDFANNRNIAINPGIDINKLIDLYKNNGNPGEIDKLEKQMLANAGVSFKHGADIKSLIKFNNPLGQEVFSGYSALPETEMSIGSFMVDAVQKYAVDLQKQAGLAVGKVSDDKFATDIIGDAPGELRNVMKNLTQSALGLFGRRPIPGLPRSWFFNSGGGLAFSLFKNNRANDIQAKNISSFLANVLDQGGNYVSRIGSWTNNPLIYNSLKDVYTIISGGRLAYNAIARGDSSGLVQLLKTFGGGNGPLDAESIFRSLGSSTSFEAAGSAELSPDYQRILGNQLQGSKIRTVDNNGRIIDLDPVNLQYKNYNDLMSLALNPYNEYPSRNIRKNIYNQLINDIGSARDNRGMSFFDPNTKNFLLGSLSVLRDWYAGNNNWLGQDYLYDKQANPDPQDRANQFTQSLGNANNLYDQANIAHRNLGAAGKFGGDLPAQNWFQNRIDAGNFATGGMVYASGGTLVNFQPRGTDTVPAMLTQGEFVVNRSATQKNLPLLKSINSGYMATGGLAGPRKVQGVTLDDSSNLIYRLDSLYKNMTDSASNTNRKIDDLTNQNAIDRKTSDNQFRESIIEIFKNRKEIVINRLGVFAGQDDLTNKIKIAYNQTSAGLHPGLLANPLPPLPFSEGGVVYAANGTLVPYSPKGTDTVPAMLTPGEFVVNAKATKNNLGLLHNINNGSKGYSKGGVAYLQRGGQPLTDEGRQALSQISTQYNIEDVLSGKVKIPGITINSENYSELPEKPAPNQEAYLQNPKIWNGFLDQSGFWWYKRGQSVISAHGPPPAMPTGQQKWQAFESVVSAFAGAGGLSRTKGLPQTFGDAIFFRSSKTNSRTVPGPLGSRVGIPSSAGRPLPPKYRGPGSGGIVLDTIKGPDGGYYVKNNDLPLPRSLTSIQNELRPTRGKKPIDLDPSGRLPRNILTDPKQISHFAAKEGVSFEEFFSLITHKTKLGRIYANVAKAMALEWFPPNNPYNINSLDKAISFFGTPTGQQFFEDKIASNISVGADIAGRYPKMLNQAGKSGGEGYTNALLRAYVQAEGFHLFSRNATIPDDLNSRLLDVIPNNKNIIGDSNVTEYLSKAGVKPQAGNKIVYYLDSLTEAGKNWSVLTPEQREWYKKFNPTATGDPSGPEQNRSQTRTSPLPRLTPTRVVPSVLYKGNLDTNNSNFWQSLTPKEMKLFQSRYEYALTTDPNKLGAGSFAKDIDYESDQIVSFRNNPKYRPMYDKMMQNLGTALRDRISPEQLMQMSPRELAIAKLLHHGGGISNIGTRNVSVAEQKAFYEAQKMRDTRQIKTQETMRSSGSPDAEKIARFLRVEQVNPELGSNEYEQILASLGGDVNKQRQRWYFPLDEYWSPESLRAYLELRTKGQALYKQAAGENYDFSSMSDLQLRMLELPATVARGYRVDKLKYMKDRLGELIVKDEKIAWDGYKFKVYESFEELATTSLNPDREFLFPSEFVDSSKVVDTKALSADMQAVLKSREMSKIAENFRFNIGRAGTTEDFPAFVASKEQEAAARRVLLENARKEYIKEPVNKYAGGIVYASEGRYIDFQPKGTDTVPAMLTPGEFVVNKRATQKNLPLLRSINSGTSDMTGYSNGGVVYLAAGGDFAETRRNAPAFFRQQFANRAKQQISLTDPNTYVMVMKDDTEGLGAINSDLRSYIFLKDFLTSDLSSLWRTQAESGLVAKKAYKEGTGADAPGKAIFRPLRGVLAEAKRMQTEQNISDLLIKEVIRQEENSPELFGPAAFSDNNLDAVVKAIGITTKIMMWEDNPELKPQEQPGVGKNIAEMKNRVTYLKNILRNINSALAIFTNNGVPNDNPAFQILSEQSQLANHELKIGIKTLEKDLFNTTPFAKKYLKSQESFQFIAPHLVSKDFAPTAINTANNVIQPAYIPEKFNKGGVVYAERGTLVPYAPRGTDTIPAMLTPGEFVVNKSSTSKHLPVLQAINNGYYNHGGSVSYLSAGTPGTDALHKSLTYLTKILRSGADELQKNLTNLSKLFNNIEAISTNSGRTSGVSNNVGNNTPNPAITIDALGTRLDNFIRQLQNVIPPVVRVEGQHTVNVQITGGSLLQNLLSGPLGGIVEEAINAAFEQRNIKNEGSNR